MVSRLDLGNQDNALVFFDWLSRFIDSDDADGLDDIERQILWDLEAALESSLPQVVARDYSTLLAEARARLRSQQGGNASSC